MVMTTGCHGFNGRCTELYITGHVLYSYDIIYGETIYN